MQNAILNLIGILGILNLSPAFAQDLGTHYATCEDLRTINQPESKLLYRIYRGHRSNLAYLFEPSQEKPHRVEFNLDAPKRRTFFKYIADGKRYILEVHVGRINADTAPGLIFEVLDTEEIALVAKLSCTFKN